MRQKTVPQTSAAEPGRLKLLTSRFFACFIKLAENLHDNSTDQLYSFTSPVTSRLRDEINVRPLFVKDGIPKLAKFFISGKSK